MGRDPGLSRREWIAACGGTITVGLTGCTGDGDGDAGGDGDEGGGTVDSGTSGGSNDGDGTSDRSVEPESVSVEGDWPMWRYDAAGNSYAADRSGPRAPLGELWSYELSSDNPMVPVVRDGTVYTQTADARCVALDAASGEELWTRDLDQLGDSTIFGPAVTEDAVYVGDDDVFALDPESGETIWKKPDLQVYERLAVDDGVVYACRQEGLQALDAASGEELWLGQTDDNVGFVSVGTDGRVYSLDWDTVVTAFDTANGDERWRYDVEGRVLGGITANDGSVYACDSEQGWLLSLSAATGEEEWRTRTGCEYHPTVAGDTIYVSSLSSVNAFDSDSGEERTGWEPSIDTSPFMSPATSETRGYIAGGSYSDGAQSIYVFDVESGSVSWEGSISDDGVGGLAVLEDVLVYGTENRITALA